MMRVAINGFGRIGKTFLRCIMRDRETYSKIQVVGINIGAGVIADTAHVFTYDTLMGTYNNHVVTMDGDELIIGAHRIKIIAECDPCALPWKKLAIDWVVECSGKFTHRDGAQKHIDAGAHAVLISAPAKDEDIAIVPGINEQLFDKNKHIIVSLGSCTTNAFMVLLKVLHNNYGVNRGWMTTIHAYTNSQVLLDISDDNVRMARAAALNIIPTTTGASKMIGKIIPELEGKIATTAIRVPVAKVSLIDLVFEAGMPLSVELLHTVFKNVSESSMKGIFGFTTLPLVSSDFSGNDNSVVVDGLLTNVNGSSAQVFGWYDNEWGYSMRMRDFLLYTLSV